MKKNLMEALQKVKFDWASISEPVADTAIRPDGLALKVRAWGPKSDRSKPADVTLLLTEFVDPAGEMTYFPADDANLGFEDELCEGPSNAR